MPWCVHPFLSSSSHRRHAQSGKKRLLRKVASKRKWCCGRDGALSEGGRERKVRSCGERGSVAWLVACGCWRRMPFEDERSIGGSSGRGGMLEQSYGTYDEVSMQHSRNFLMALQELKNLRPQLYSAAEYCESSYLYSDQKQVVLENLKDYSVKALVNAVDHLGTVAFKLNDLLCQQVSEVSSSEIRAASLAQRIRSCQEHSDREGLKQQSLAKSTQANHKHYVLPDVAEVAKRTSDQDVVMLRETFDPEQVQSQAQSSDGLGSSRNLAWHFAVDRSPAKNGSSSTLNRPRSRQGASPGRRELDASLHQDSDSSNASSGLLSVSDRSKSKSRSKSTERARAAERSKSAEKSRPPEKTKSLKMPGRSQSTERRPSSKLSTSNNKVASLERSISHMNLTESDRSGPSRSRSLLRSLLSRGRNGPTLSCVPSFQ